VNDLLKRLHILVGLCNLTALVVFAVTGITETFPNLERTADARTVEYEAPGGLDDGQVASHVVSTLQIPLIVPLQPGAVHRNDANLVTFDFYSANGPGTVTVLEPEKKARIEVARISLGRFMTEVHGTRLSDAAILRVRLWALYISCSIVSLIFMAVTGPWLWLASRPELVWARVAFVSGIAVFAVLWFLTR